MDDSRGDDERRRSTRINVEGMALLWSNDRIAGRYRLNDLSAEGCQLRDGPPCTLHAEYGVVLDLEPHATTRLSARLVRQRSASSGRYVLGLQFLGAAPWTEELIEGLLLKNVAREFPPGQGRVLVVDGDATRLSDIADSLRVLGCSVLEARNPVEAVWELENGLMDVHTVFIARRLGTGDGRDLVRFIGSRYAGVRRVMLADRSVAEAHEADVVVVGPFDPLRLRKIIPGALLAAASGPRLRLQSA